LGGGLLGPGLGGCPLGLCLAGTLLDAGLVRLHGGRDLGPVSWALPRVGGQAPPRPCDQLGGGPAGAPPGEGVGEVARRGGPDGGAAIRPGEGRPAAEDGAEDGAQAEDVGALVKAADLAAGLLRGHVRWRPQNGPGAGALGERGVWGPRWVV